MGLMPLAVAGAAVIATIITIATQPVSSVELPDLNRAAKADRLDVRQAVSRPGRAGSAWRPRQRIDRPPPVLRAPSRVLIVAGDVPITEAQGAV